MFNAISGIEMFIKRISTHVQLKSAVQSHNMFEK